VEDVSETFLLCKKWRGAINVASMRSFGSRAELETHLRSDGQAGGWTERWFLVYRTFSDKPPERLLAKEKREIGFEV